MSKGNKRNSLLYFLKKNNIEASAHFDPPLHKQNYLKKFNKYKLKNTELLSKQIITLPIYPSLKKSETDIILNTINKWCKKNEKK